MTLVANSMTRRYSAQEIIRNQEKHGKNLRRPDKWLVVFENNFKGAAYGTGGTNLLTFDTPLGALVALFLPDNSYHIINQHQRFTSAHADT